jgi:hypothetical protein
LAIATASGSQNGLLSSTDWTTFNNKQNALTNPVTGTGTTNYLPKFTGSTTIGNSGVFENGTNIGIGTASPRSIDSTWGILTINGSSSGSMVQLRRGEVNAGYLYSDIFGTTLFETRASSLVLGTSGTEAMRIFPGRNVHIGPTPASDNGARLQVSGTATFSSSVTATGFSVNNSGFRGGIYPYLSVAGSGSDNSLTLFSEGGANQGNIYFCPNGSATKLMTINTSGNVLIGTTTDASGKLQVLGITRLYLKLKGISKFIHIFLLMVIIQALDGGASSYVPLRIEASSTTFSSTVETTACKSCFSRC